MPLQGKQWASCPKTEKIPSFVTQWPQDFLFLIGTTELMEPESGIWQIDSTAQVWRDDEI